MEYQMDMVTRLVLVVSPPWIFRKWSGKWIW